MLIKLRFLPLLSAERSRRAICQLPPDSWLQGLCGSRSGEREGSVWLLINWGSVSSGSKSRPILSFSNSLAKLDAKLQDPEQPRLKLLSSLLLLLLVAVKGKDAHNTGVGKSRVTREF